MNVIFCSTKLAKLLNVKTKVDALNAKPTIMGHWNAHLFYYQRKKCVIFMNKLSLYSVTVYDYKKTDLLTLKLLFLKSLESQCKWDSISLSKENLRLHFGEIEFSTTDNDKSAIGSLNDLIYHAQCCLESGSPAVHFSDQGNILFNMNKTPMSPLKFGYPSETFVRFFSGA